MGPVGAYQELVRQGEIAADPAQERAAVHLARLHEALVDWRPGKRAGLLARFGLGVPVTPPEGVYLCGDVGRGKSMLMDLFFDGAPVARKTRVHFHEFMSQTHDRIFRWRQREKEGGVGSGKRGRADPIARVARQIAREATLLCFDEFQVEDIADASILGRLFTQLFDLGVVVVATSNQTPDQLYEGGLNRQRFLPFIALIKERMEVLQLDSETDYRLDRMRGMPVYHTPLGLPAQAAMDGAFAQATGGASGAPCTLAVKGHRLDVPRGAHGVARFGFADLCARPLGAADYLKIADMFHTVLIDDVPVLTPERRNEAKRFVTLIDALYERKTRVIMSAEAPPQALYPAGDGVAAFRRTVSRLMEMQSDDYLATLRD